MWLLCMAGEMEMDVDGNVDGNMDGNGNGNGNGNGQSLPSYAGGLSIVLWRIRGRYST